MVISKIPWLVTLRFVGQLGATELAAAALAMTLRNLTGLSLSVGLSSALATLTSQSRGQLQAKLAERKNQKQTEGVDSKLFMEYDNDIETVELEERLGFLGRRNERVLSSNALPRAPLLPLVYYYRGIFLQLAFVIPIFIWWWKGLRPFLVALGQEEQLAAKTDSYLRILAPGLIFYSINWTTIVWLQSIEMAFLPAYASCVGALFHIPLNVFFIHFMGWGYLGAAAATTTYELIQPTLLLSYTFGTSAGSKRVLHNIAASAVDRYELSFWQESIMAVSSWTGVKEYLGLAIPGLVSISEWWASETCIFLSGRLTPLPEVTLGAMALFQSINTFCFMFPVSFGIAGAARVGSLLGRNDPHAASFAGLVSVASASSVSALIGIMLFIIPHGFFPSLFAPSEDDLIKETMKIIPLLALYVFADGTQTALNGVIKGCGRQAVAMPAVIVSYWVVGVPLAYYLAFVRHLGTGTCDDGYFCGVVGLVAGTTTGTWLHMILFGVVVFAFTDWEEQAEKAQFRVQKELHAAPTMSFSSNETIGTEGDEEVELTGVPDTT
ncbi:multidrug resistance protein, MATE family [Fistulifera solaris]|uniref:Multidrug resistance protein, MATE family n=1 Tax=Fistulifera solaris TaxID=1519565 RepID=A0A1Z5KGG0_FISSO|nr:multidrug resistance protein, MATE family [Fistulifera solaris]|eukprot:GAX25058.1 multidrug resistance protein, MATE family [Fistulifera solaris]